MHEEPPLLVITLWLSLFAAAAILHTIVHQFFNILLLLICYQPFHESSLQYIGKDCLVTWIECNPKISGDSLICQPFELQLILLEDSF